MKGEISKGGYLLIERAGNMKAQICPLFSNNTIVDGMPCGDWCPLFGEPEKIKFNIDYIIIQLCQKAPLYFKQFIDERKDPHD